MRTAVRVTAAALLAATLAAVTACAAGPEPGARDAAVAPAPPAAASPSGSASAPASASPAVVPAALSFTGKTLDGTAFDAAALAGRPVVLWFWAPWCATCASQAWTVAEIAPAYRDTVPIVGVAGLGEQKAMKSFVSEFDLAGTTQIDDRAGALWRRFKVAEQSTFVVLDRTGRVVHQGFLDGEALTRQVETLARG
ncbi:MULTISPECIES: redoxin family protein [unclassified Micromonospora]|uniref:TlpA family protein disulfide reductase n=1 Tax=unclassified Micromonospora TaxID=2617518 RepID=UPI00188EC6BD|nr:MULTISPECIES: redoxin family protein [unclassified Micromonospora]MBF5032562.1 redoxin family protein [Micromonospora sp. ANENR4]MCZ7476871.1 redoxin family protein [Micromonospora sp. WMMC273]WBC01681.1 redoxin family protein [Micromonospora sp. WMMA1976]